MMFTHNPQGDGDSEIALVVEDNDMVETYMDGQKYMASRFATSLRRKRIYPEHLGLIPPQICEGPNERVTSYMRPAPVGNHDEFGTPEDNAVADPLSPATEALWNDTAKRNREIFTEIFRPVPTNLIRSWSAYGNYVPNVKTGHVVPEIPLARIKDRLSQVRGALVECPLDFLIDQKDFIEGPIWSGYDPALPLYV